MNISGDSPNTIFHASFISCPAAIVRGSYMIVHKTVSLKLEHQANTVLASLIRHNTAHWGPNLVQEYVAFLLPIMLPG